MGEEADIREDALLGGRVRLLQARAGHRAGTDAVLLAAACPAESGQTVGDFGSGTGAVGLMIAARRPGCSVVFVEREPTLARLCEQNISLNGIEGRGNVVVTDLLASGDHADLPPESLDWVVTNPPYLDEDASRPSPDPSRARAHHMPAGGLDRWIGSARRSLKSRGRLVIIHRADKLPESLAALSGFGGIAITPIYPKEGADASRVIVAAVKGGRAAPRIRGPLVLHGPDGRFSAGAEVIHRGEAALA